MTQQTRTPRSRLAPDQPAATIAQPEHVPAASEPDVTPACKATSGLDSAATPQPVESIIVDIRLPFFSVVRLMIYVVMATVPAGIFIALFVFGLLRLLSR